LVRCFIKLELYVMNDMNQ